LILFAPETWPFGAALAVMVGLFIVEGVGFMLSMSPSSLFDAWLPDIPDGAQGLNNVLGWLHVGKVPILILLGLLLGGFALAGYVIQATVGALGLGLLPAWIASFPAFFAALSMTKLLGGSFARLIPLEQTTAVSESSLIGRAGVVTEGIAKQGLAAQAKVKDVHGNYHYILVEPDLGDQTFAEGEAIVLVRKTGATYRAISNPRPDLL
jgi:membrane protein implicated in regulation of membrane protease activity